jgi:DNA-binding NarL/FixJ family response regulator
VSLPGNGLQDGPDAPRGGEREVRVLVVDDQESFRSAMREVVAATEGFTLVGEAPSGEAALELVDELAPHLAIIDKRMPGLGGIQTTRILTDRYPDLVVVLVSVEARDPRAMQSLGSTAFVRKQDLSPRVLREVWRDHAN